MRAFILAHWYRPSLSLFSILLLPLAWLFRLIIFCRKKLIKPVQINLPVIVVGNITVGGTGKTPFIIWLSAHLKKLGYRPGILTRGVGGKGFQQPHVVSMQDDVADIGDEAKLLFIRTQAPLVICIDRVAGAQKLLALGHCDIILCDDGLQHYALKRDIEIVMIDSTRGFGNGQLLPAGPLREPITRLQSVDFVVSHPVAQARQYLMQWQPQPLVALHDATLTKPLSELANQSVYAVAGIGHPERFFEDLTRHGLRVIPKIFPDHYAYQAEDLLFPENYPVLMTEKDAVKCVRFTNLPLNRWFLPISIEMPPEFIDALHIKLKAICINKL